MSEAGDDGGLSEGTTGISLSCSGWPGKLRNLRGLGFLKVLGEAGSDMEGTGKENCSTDPSSLNG